MALKRTSTAIWKGTGMEGKGAFSSTSGAFKEIPYSFVTRFQNEDGKAGTNPEELIAAAHASCFSMALSFQLDAAGFTATELKAKATVSIDKTDAGFQIMSSHIELDGKVPNISNEKFQELAENAKKGCPVSKALAAINVTLTAKLV